MAQNEIAPAGQIRQQKFYYTYQLVSGPTWVFNTQPVHAGLGLGLAVALAEVLV